MNYKHKLHGFTLVEILIVLAIIAVLASILFAVIGRAKENGRRSVCQSNLKQIAFAVQEYVQDNNGEYPADTDEDLLAPYLPKTPDPDTQFFMCPTQQARSDIPYHYLYSPMLLASVDDTAFLRPRHESALARAAKIWLNSDNVDSSNSNAKAVPPNHDHSGCLVATWHSGGANYSFLDGHVKWYSPEAACSFVNTDPGQMKD